MLRRHGGEPLCAKSTLQLFRAHLVLHDQAKAIFKGSVQEAKRVGLLKGEAKRVARIKKGTAKGRIPSAADPEVRHGRKSKSKRFNGHKASVATEVESGILVALDVLSGDSADSTGALEMTEQAEENAGMPVAETLGDCAYGSGATRQEFVDASRTLIAKVPQENQNHGLFPKSAFVIHREARTATCPGGHTTDMADDHQGGGRTFYFDEFCQGCALRGQCTTSALGRSLSEHPQEALLKKAREYQATPAGKANLRKRVMVENSLGRLAHLGLGQAIYRGRTMTLFQLTMAGTAHTGRP